jgi:hypothetical protein
MTDADLLPRRVDGLHLLALNGESVLCDGEGRTVCAMNETAVALWDLCDGETGPDEIVMAIVQLCGLPHDMAQAHVDEALSTMTAVGVIEWGSE